jgi:hypothetical protein
VCSIHDHVPEGRPGAHSAVAHDLDSSRPGRLCAASVRTELVVCAHTFHAFSVSEGDGGCGGYSASETRRKFQRAVNSSAPLCLSYRVGGPVTARKRPALPVCVQGRSLCTQGRSPLALARALVPACAHSRRDCARTHAWGALSASARSPRPRPVTHLRSPLHLRAAPSCWPRSCGDISRRPSPVLTRDSRH